MRVKILYIYIWLLTMPSQLYAQNNSHQFSHLDINNGLSDNQVNCIYKDEKGFMWFGKSRNFTMDHPFYCNLPGLNKDDNMQSINVVDNAGHQRSLDSIKK